MQLNPVASTVLVIFYLITSVCLVAILGFFLYSLNKLNAKLESLEEKIDPLMVKAEEILTLTSEKIVTFGERTEGILSHGEAVAEDVHDKVDRTAVTVQRTINAPIIGLNSMAVGLVRGLNTFSLLQRKQAAKKIETVETSVDNKAATVASAEFLSTDHLAQRAVETTVTLNRTPVALRSGRE